MLTRSRSTFSSLDGRGLRIAIVAAQYNPPLVDALLERAVRTLERASASPKRIVRVPGSYEIPVAAMRLARTGKFDAILALGVVLQGKTSHADHIAMACAINLQRIAIETGVPVIHQILTPRTLKDARDRVHQRGAEAAQAAIDVARALKEIKP